MTNIGIEVHDSRVHSPLAQNEAVVDDGRNRMLRVQL